MPLRRMPLGLFPNQPALVGQSETQHVERRREGGVDFKGSFQLISDLRMSVPVEILVEALIFEEILRSPSKNGARTKPSPGGGADENYCCPGRNCTGARACALACVGGSVDTGLRVGVAIGGGGAVDVLGRRFCSEALAIARAICSWLALNCSAVLAFSRANSSWLVLSCSIPCCTFARSRAIVWSNCASSGGIGAAAGATPCGAV